MKVTIDGRAIEVEDDSAVEAMRASGLPDAERYDLLATWHGYGMPFRITQVVAGGEYMTARISTTTA